MKVFFRAQLSSLIATLIDFMMTIFMVEISMLHYTLAAFIGALCGAITNFIINRYWSFEATGSPVKSQSLKYGIVWVGSTALNVSGIYALTHFFGIKYFISKLIVAIFVGITFNYILQKQYVFTRNEKISS